MAPRRIPARLVAALAALGLMTGGLAALAQASDTDDDGPEIESISGTVDAVAVTFDEAIQPPTPGDFAFEHFGQGAESPHVHRPQTVTMLDDHTVLLEGLRPLHPGIGLPLVAAYVQDLSGNVSAPKEQFEP